MEKGCRAHLIYTRQGADNSRVQMSQPPSGRDEKIEARQARRERQDTG
jgi:hypothetical protein